MKLVNDFYNKLVTELHKTYFPTVKYLKDTKQNTKICYAIECFSNGVLGYDELIANLAINCEDNRPVYLHLLVSKFVLDFEGFEPNIFVEYHRQPTKGEIKFGEGAIHYRDFPIERILKTDSFGLKRFKQWFVSPDDKLRYYY